MTQPPLGTLLTPTCMTGQSHDHVTGLVDNCPLHPTVADAFTAMQQAALAAGHDLHIASGFRSYARQMAIWQRKVAAIESSTDNDYEQALLAILHWSAMPGASRHHWGSDMDVYDKSALADRKLQLEPWEYSNGGPFAALSEWLAQHASNFGFYWPYDQDRGGVAAEPWHLSYAPVARVIEQQFKVDHLLAAWLQQAPAAHVWLKQHAPQLFNRFVKRVAEAPSACLQ